MVRDALGPDRSRSAASSASINRSCSCRRRRAQQALIGGIAQQGVLKDEAGRPRASPSPADQISAAHSRSSASVERRLLEASDLPSRSRSNSRPMQAASCATSLAVGQPVQPSHEHVVQRRRHGHLRQLPVQRARPRRAASRPAPRRTAECRQSWPRPWPRAAAPARAALDRIRRSPCVATPSRASRPRASCVSRAARARQRGSPSRPARRHEQQHRRAGYGSRSAGRSSSRSSGRSSARPRPAAATAAPRPVQAAASSRRLQRRAPAGLPVSVPPCRAGPPPNPGRRRLVGFAGRLALSRSSRASSRNRASPRVQHGREPSFSTAGHSVLSV